MRKLLVFSLVLGMASVGAYADDLLSLNLGPNGNFPGPVASGDGPTLVWDNGVANGVNGVLPTAGWDIAGVIDNFNLPSGAGTIFNQVRIETIDATAGPGQPSTVDEARIRIYELGPGGLAGLTFGVDVPVFDQTYSEAAGTMTEIDSGIDMFGFDLLYFDLSGPETDLGPGEFALFVNYPDAPAGVNTYIAYSAHPFTNDDARVFGTGADGLPLNSPFAIPSDVAFNLSIPEPATLSLLGIGALALLRRRR